MFGKLIYLQVVLFALLFALLRILREQTTPFQFKQEHTHTFI